MGNEPLFSNTDSNHDRCLTINPFCNVTILQVSTHLAAAPAKKSSNQNPFGNTESLQYTGGSDPNNKNYSKLTEKLNEADIERRKIAEEAERRERAAEIRREERLAKIKYMTDMPDTQPAGTGALLLVIFFLISTMSCFGGYAAMCLDFFFNY